jgi:hypothetical protein
VFVLFVDVYARRGQVQKASSQTLTSWESREADRGSLSPDPSRVPPTPPRGAPDTFATKTAVLRTQPSASAVRAIGLPLGSVDVITDSA